MNFVAASYYHRYGDPIGTFVALGSYSSGGQRTCEAALKAEGAAERAADFEREELLDNCDTQCGDCAFCCPDVIAGMAFTYRARDLFSAAELREHRRALMRGEVIFLTR